MVPYYNSEIPSSQGGMGEIVGVDATSDDYVALIKAMNEGVG